MNKWELFMQDAALEASKSSGGNKDFGNLEEGVVYEAEIVEVKDTKDKDNFLVKAKIVDGPSGIGTWVSGFYDFSDKILEEMIDGKKNWRRIFSLKLVHALGITGVETANGKLIPVPESVKNSKGKRISLSVKPNGQYWNINPFSVAVSNGATITGKPVTLSEPAADADDFGF